jgi:hypothetical protein
MFTLLKHICILVATSKVWAKGLVIQSMKKRTITKEVDTYAQSPLLKAIINILGILPVYRE